jgi:hypothetical protein
MVKGSRLGKAAAALSANPTLGQSGRWTEGGEGGLFESSTREILVLAPQPALDHPFV